MRAGFYRFGAILRGIDISARKDIGARLKQIREGMKLTQENIAPLLKVAKNTYQTYESGQRVPDGEALAPLAEMGVSIDWLLTGRGRPYNAMAVNKAPLPPHLQSRLLQSMGDLAQSSAPPPDNPAPYSVNQQRLVEVLEMVEEELADVERPALAKKAALIAWLYNKLEEGQRLEDIRGDVRFFAKLAS